jgi:two-component system NarL family sensor kinase
VLAVAWANSVTILGTGWALATYHADLPARAFFAWWGAWPWAPAFLIGSSLVLLVYPSGRTTSRFGHRLALASLVSAAGLVVGIALLDGPYDSVVAGHSLGVNPISHGHLQGPLLVLTVASAALGVVVALLTWGHTVRRFWHATSPEREQLAWLVVAVVPTMVVAPLNSAWIEFVVNLLTTAALAIGIVRHQLFDIKLVVRSGLVYGSLTALSVGSYFAVVALITTVTPSGPVPTLFAVAAVGLLVVPAHRLLQRFFGRLVYGDRGDPIRALGRWARGCGPRARKACARCWPASPRRCAVLGWPCTTRRASSPRSVHWRTATPSTASRSSTPAPMSASSSCQGAPSATGSAAPTAGW